MAEEEGPDWSRGAPPERLLHPWRIQIVEAIRRADRPLSAADLVPQLGPSPARIECHLRCLRRLGVVLPTGEGRPGRPAFNQRYRLKAKRGT